MMIDIITREIKMPMTYQGFIKVDPDGIFNIYINEDMPDWIKRRALDHEIEHAQNGDFESNLPVELIEAANNAEADLTNVCWIGRNQVNDFPDKILREMSKVADSGKILSIFPKE
jgi:hypothetical protein